jgi:hypothetical protein
VIKARTWLALVLVSFGTLAATVSCGSDEVTGGGVGGGLITGAGNGGAAGKGGGAVGRGGSSGTGGSSSLVSTLGQSCALDSDCGGGLTCLLPNNDSLGTGGPANGACSLPCTQNSDCTAVEAGAGCVSFDGTTGFCFQSCVLGDVPDITTKCQGRPDFLCVDFAAAADPSNPLCTPLCQADLQCGSGAYCSPQTGLCVKTKPTGDPIGTACDPNAVTDTCLGFCLPTSPTGAVVVTGACADICSGGTSCLFTGSKPGGYCATPTGTSLLELALCEPLCNCDSDCPFPGDVCQAWLPAASMLQTQFGSAGFCFPNANGSTELTCSEGGAGGAGGAPGTGGAAGEPLETAGAGGAH